ncbi:Methyl-CpG-binding domain protein 2 [Halotydeus destructor]|nr:Methyl-CpG-binding domain protein 2 [Halotydeus destructor]
MDHLALPKGWKREENVRRSGLSAGKIDVCYYSPNGIKFKTKPQLARYLGDMVDLSSFDFRTGKINATLLRSKAKKYKSGHDFRVLRNDPSLLPPIRQTASIFKQPVTIIKTQPDSKTKNDPKYANASKPKQVFWEKRLQGLRATIADYDEDIENFKLPKSIMTVGPNLKDDSALRSISTALHLNGHPITGQTISLGSLEKNPGVFLNTVQPHVAALKISDEDIKSQEDRVRLARRSLQQALQEAY